DTNENEPQTQNPNDSQDPPTHTDGDGNTQSPFTHPALRGLTEEDIAARIALSASTIRSQSRRLSALEEEVQRKAASSTGTAADTSAVPADIQASDFWTSPHTVLPKVIEPLIKKQLQETVGPLLA